MRQGRDLKLRNPIRERKHLPAFVASVASVFEIKKPHKGTETILNDTQQTRLKSFEIKKPHKGTETVKQV